MSEQLNKQPARYVWGSWAFMRLLGVVYLLAFLSIWWQLEGLLASDGILAVSRQFEWIAERVEGWAFWRVPSLFWIVGTSDAALHAVCAAGVVLSVLLIGGATPLVVLPLLWALYLSIQSAGAVFLGYQWDILLLEAGFLAMFIAPRLGRARLLPGAAPSQLGLWVLWFLSFKLMFMSGLVKLRSGDLAWRDLSALDYHFFTQPIPTWTSYYAHHMPSALLRASTAVMFVIEVALPFMIVLPARFRRIAGFGSIALQLGIMATGNYGFFNLLSIALAVILIDDRAILGLCPARLRARLEAIELDKPSPLPKALRVVFVSLAFAMLTLSALRMTMQLVPTVPIPAPAKRVVEVAQRFRIVSNYGLFAVMTKTRPEIELEGSRDGLDWQSYTFYWKPGPLDRAPSFAGPHMPRLDWQMWFAGLGNCARNPWLIAFQQRLLEGNSPAAGLLKDDPFADQAPRYIRTTLYHYEFTSMEQRRADPTRPWWRRELVGSYCPVLTLQDGELQAVQ